MADAPRIDVQNAREKIVSEGATLVCAYEDEEKCNRLRVEGALSLAESRSNPPPKSEEVIFYCA